jgi:predicted LPLAT superfamily acyltransferase
MEKRNMTQDWTQKKEHGSARSLRFMVWLATTLGRRATRVLLYPIAVYFVLRAGDARQASIEYLTKVLGRKPAWHELFRHFYTFSCVLLDRVFLLLGHAGLFDIRIVENAYAEQDATTRANGVFLMGAHMGSFEAVRLVSRTQADLKLVLLMYEENARKIGALIAAINPKAQQEIVPLGNVSAMLTVRDRLAEGAVVGILADRTLKHEKEIRIPFLGAPAYLAAGPFRMAAMLRRPVFLMVGLYRGGNRYDIHLEKIADFGNIAGNRDEAVEAAIHRYAERLEHFVRLAPYNWFNFYDFWQGDA